MLHRKERTKKDSNFLSDTIRFSHERQCPKKKTNAIKANYTEDEEITVQFELGENDWDSQDHSLILRLERHSMKRDHR